MPELLIGAGSRHQKRLSWNDRDEWTKLVTLDINSDHKPDVVWDLNDTDLPFDDNTFDEIHAYEVLEHTGQQGDWRFFFAQWSGFWRILKPGGLFLGTSPAHRSNWAWGDPGHTRIVQEENFVFLHQPSYTGQVGKFRQAEHAAPGIADQDRRLVDQQFVDAVFSQQRTIEPRAGLGHARQGRRRPEGDPHRAELRQPERGHGGGRRGAFGARPVDRLFQAAQAVRQAGRLLPGGSAPLRCRSPPPHRESGMQSSTRPGPARS